MEMFPEAPVYTLLFDKEKVGEALAGRDVRMSFLQKFPKWLRKRYQWLLPLYPVAVETFDLRDFDLVISSSGAWSKGVVTRLNTKHIAYVHSPMRYVWDANEQYLREIGGGKFSLCKRLLLSYLRVWDREAADRPDALIANSLYTQARIEKYYRRESVVVYPPLKESRVKSQETRSGRQGTGNKKRETGKENGEYFLAVSRLSPSKRVDVLVDAFNKLGLPLIVAGEGREKERLRKMAKENVRVVGWQSDEELEKLYTDARAFVFAAEEDFGMVLAEALAHGVPVIAYGQGGAREIVQEGRTGELFASQKTEVVADGVRRFLEHEASYDKEEMCRSVERFSRERFQREIMEIVGRV